jgi:hypothetical protein
VLFSEREVRAAADPAKHFYRFSLFFSFCLLLAVESFDSSGCRRERNAKQKEDA